MTPGSMTLFGACAALVTKGDLEDPLSAIRDKLLAYAEVLAAQSGDPEKSWSVYVEYHVVGVRFMIRDASGREVDLQQLPANPAELP